MVPFLLENSGESYCMKNDYIGRLLQTWLINSNVRNKIARAKKYNGDS
ncbi:hypothetical protein THZG08_180049 [Vibrio owensii]|nr:hypothetical protein THZG08_180049 [Vibrio owensii]CAH1555354.1 hypothetical protein THOA03_180047 [Vibrio owensii]